MEEAVRHEWRVGDPSYKFPASGLLVEMVGAEARGALGFRPGSAPDWCEIVHESYADGVDWTGLIGRVAEQARKGKYSSARVFVEPSLPEELELALRAAGFDGSPFARALACNAPKHLQPYLDWDGRLIRMSAGKGSETVNTQLLEFVASRIPADGPYSEREINGILRQLSRLEDNVTLRRDLVDRGHITRTPDGREYRKLQAPDSWGGG